MRAARAAQPPHLKHVRICPAPRLRHRLVPVLEAHCGLQVVVPRAQPVVRVARGPVPVEAARRVLSNHGTSGREGDSQLGTHGHHSLVGHELASSTVQSPQWQFSIS